MKKMITFGLLLCGAVVVSCSTTDKNEHSGMVDENATAETKALYENLKTSPEKGIMFGHQDDTAYGIGWKYEDARSDVQSITGDYPAVYGWEIGGIERLEGNSLDDVEFEMIVKLIIEAYQRGGVNTVSWHMDNFVTGSNSWDLTGGNVVKTLLDGGVNHSKFKEALDLVAEFAHKLKTKDGVLIPIIFRPWHEHTGSWFWWGREFCSIEEYGALWRFTVEYLRDTKGVHNFIYSYSPDRVANQAEYIERYPGDEYVDMFGLDLYHFDGDGREQGIEHYKKDATRSLKVLKELANAHKKPYAFTETGLECVTIDNWFTEILMPVVENSGISYVLVWRNAYEKPNHYYAPYPGHPASSDLKSFKENEKILFNGEIDNLYTNK